MAVAPVTQPTALIYCRVSTRKQEEDGASLDTQEQGCREHAESLGYAIGPIFREVYTGAEVVDRPELNRLREAARTGVYGAVLVYSIDRLTRAQGVTGYLLQEFDRHGAKLISVTDPLEETPAGRFILSANEFAAEIEREKIRERSLRGKKARVLDGKFLRAGQDLYGYRRDKEGTRREVYELEAEVIRWIFHAVAVDGMSARSVWRSLNERGVPGPAATKRDTDDGEAAKWTHDGHYQKGTGTWGQSTVNNIIHNPAYKGDTILWRYESTGKGTRRRSVLRDPADNIRLADGTTPALVSPELWQAAQERLKTNRSIRTRNENRPRLLRGLIFCALCGHPMYPEISRGEKTYNCTTRKARQQMCPAKRAPADDRVDLREFNRMRPRNDQGIIIGGITADQVPGVRGLPGVETWVWEQVSALLRDPTRVAAELQNLKDAEPDTTLIEQAEGARTRLARIEGQQRRLVQQFGEAEGDDFPWALVQEQISRLEKEKVTLQGIIADAERQMAQQQHSVDQLEALTVYIDRVARNLESFGFEEKRLALEALGVRVYANGRDWRLECNIPIPGDVNTTSW
jgi:site-specific DNA recombinase